MFYRYPMFFARVWQVFANHANDMNSGYVFNNNLVYAFEQVEACCLIPYIFPQFTRARKAKNLNIGKVMSEQVKMQSEHFARRDYRPLFYI